MGRLNGYLGSKTDRTRRTGEGSIKDDLQVSDLHTWVGVSH